MIFLLTAIPAGASPTTPGGGASAGQVAFASWMVTDGGQKWLYFGAGQNMAPNTQPSMGFIGRIPCKEVVMRGRTLTRCRGGSRSHALTPGDFVMDPSLNSASLTVESNGESHSISWTGRGPQPEPYFHQHAGLDIGVLVMVMLQRRSDTSATIFGNDLTGRRGVMFEEVYGEAWPAVLRTPDGTRLEFRDGVLRVSKTFR
jgi:hypothetical protein